MKKLLSVIMGIVFIIITSILAFIVIYGYDVTITTMTEYGMGFKRTKKSAEAGGFESQIKSAEADTDDNLFEAAKKSNVKPYKVAAESGSFATIASGGKHTMVIKADDSLWAWGMNAFGQIGDGTTTTFEGGGDQGIVLENNDKPFPVKIMDGVVSVSAGYNYTMAIKTDGSLWAWGHNRYGVLGDGIVTTFNSSGKVLENNDKSSPIKIMDDVASVSAGGTYAMAVKTDGSLWAWGNNEYGQLGDGTTTDRAIPVKIMDDVVSVSAEKFHTMAIKTDGSLWAWGDNEYGQLGNGTDRTGTNKESYRVERIYYWGEKHENYIITSPIKIMNDVKSVSVGGNHTVAIKTDGSLWAWGNNEYGQLGDGTVTTNYFDETARRQTLLENNNKSTPIKIMNDVAFAMASENYTMAIKTNNSLWSWGDNQLGRLGDGTYTMYNYADGDIEKYNDKFTPVEIMEEAAFVSLGSPYTMAIKTDGSLWAWGRSNYYGDYYDPPEGWYTFYDDFEKKVGLFPSVITDGVKLPSKPAIPVLSQNYNEPEKSDKEKR